MTFIIRHEQKEFFSKNKLLFEFPIKDFNAKPIYMKLSFMPILIAILILV